MCSNSILNPSLRIGLKPQARSFTIDKRSSTVGVLDARTSGGASSGQRASPRLRMSRTVSGRDVGYLHTNSQAHVQQDQEKGLANRPHLTCRLPRRPRFFLE